MLELFNQYWPLFVLVVTTVVAWFKDAIFTKLGIKKEKKETEFIAVEVLERNLVLYQEMLNDVDTRYKTKVEELELQFQESIFNLKIDLEELRIINSSFKTIIEEQKMIIENQKILITKQSKSLEYYKGKYDPK